jgi:SAM-dependent methyltransferase
VAFVAGRGRHYHAPMGTAGETAAGQGTYATGFYEGQLAGSLRSAEVVVPLLIDLVRPASVLDVGCGVGTWLRAFVGLGVTDVVGVDGDYVDRSLLQIDPEAFRPTDISRPLDLGRRFDLVISLEVAEHLDAGDADTLVDSIVRHGDAVAFSAAVPFQDGTHHVNEQWPDYWIDKFAARSYACLDILRPTLWDRPEVEFWYAQNLFLFVAEDELAGERWAAVNSLPTFNHVNAIHPRLYQAQHQPAPVAAIGPKAQAAIVRQSLRDLGRVAATMPGSVYRAARKRWDARRR